MADDKDAPGTEPAAPAPESSDAARRVAALTGMTPEAAETFAAYHSGRFAQRSAFDAST
jgi:hypothetical protein